MNILLCLLSDQHVPNLVSIHELRPDRLVLLESVTMERRSAAANLLDALRQGGLEYAERCDVVRLDSEESLPVVREALRNAHALHPAADWTVNLTGGTKLMSIAAYDHFHAGKARLIYTSYKQPDQLRDVVTDTLIPCRYRPTIVEFLAGYGVIPHRPMAELAAQEQLAREWWSAACCIARKAPMQSFLNFDPGAAVPPAERNSARDKIRTKAREKGLVLPSTAYQPGLPEVAAELGRAFGLRLDDEGAWSGELSRQAVQFLLGGWLEVFWWGLLERHAAALGLSDVRLGFVVRGRAAQTTHEFDVAFMSRHGLGMIECKSGDQEHDRSFEILYKLEAILSGLGALRTQSWLSVTTSRIYGATGALKEHIADRLKIYRCELIEPSQLAAVAAEPENVDLVRTVLFPPRANRE